MKNLLPSKKQHALLEFIDRFIKEHDYAPSYREIARALDYKSVSTVATHINGLIERGWLVKRENAKRSVEVIYKAGQTQSNSPAPSLPATHEQWLRNLIGQKLIVGTDQSDIHMVCQALALLGLTDVMTELPATEVNAGQ
jgi:SOS-response transcriptional repressor LexA